jgi:hypothetical protein
LEAAAIVVADEITLMLDFLTCPIRSFRFVVIL